MPPSVLSNPFLPETSLRKALAHFTVRLNFSESKGQPTTATNCCMYSNLVGLRLKEFQEGGQVCWPSLPSGIALSSKTTEGKKGRQGKERENQNQLGPVLLHRNYKLNQVMLTMLERHGGE